MVGRNKQTIDMNFTIENELPPINFTIEILMSPPSENSYTTLVKRTQPFCDFAMGKYVDPILKIIYEEFQKRAAKLISKCLVAAVRRIFLRIHCEI